MNNKSLVANAVTLISGTAIGQLVALLALPLLTRLYTPHEFGLFAVYTGILSLGTVIVCVRYELAIVLPKKDRTALLVFKLCLLATCVISLFSTIFIWIFGETIESFYEVSSDSSWLWLISVGVFVGGAYKASVFWHTRKRSYGKLARSKMSQSLSQTFSQLILGFSAFGVTGLILGEIIGKICGTMMLRSKYRLRLSVANRLTVKTASLVAARYKKFPLVSTWSSLINQMGMVAPTVFLAGYFGADVAGFYAIAQRLLAVPMDLVGQSILSLYVGEFSEQRRSHPLAMHSLFLKFGTRMFIVGALPLIVVLFFGDKLITTFLGVEWSDAGDYAKILAFAFWFRFAISPLSQTLNLIDRQDIQLVWDVSRLVLVVSGFVVSYIFDLTPLETMMIYSGIIILSQVSYAVITLGQLKRVGSC